MTSDRAPDEIGQVPFGIKALLLVLFTATFGVMNVIPSVALQVFDITERELDLGLLGLAEFLPILLFSPFTGTVADRFDRRFVYGIGLVLELLVAVALFFYTLGNPTSLLPIFALMSFFGFARSLVAPSSRAMPIDLAPPDVLERVIALKSLAFQIAIISGPIVGAFAYAAHPSIPYAIAVAAFCLAIALLLTIVPSSPVERLETAPGPRQAIRDAVGGLRFIRRTPVLLGAVSLDLAAVLLGGAVALLPAIAEKRLGVGPIGFGFLRAGIGFGAAGMALALSIRPLKRRVGPALFTVVAIFGAATIVLGLTRTYVVALLALVVLSAADQVSVFIRSSLVPLATPESMRGRVLAVENIFIGGSNELGALESGLAAAAIGISATVVFGGVGTLLVAAIWWRAFPAIANVDRFADVRVQPVNDTG